MTVSSSSRGARPGAASGGDQVTGVPLSVRLRRWRPFILAVGLLLIVTVVGTLTESQHSKTPFAIDNPKHDGTQALARLLRQEGVSVETVRSQEAAVRAAEPGTTVALLDAGLLTEDERSELARTGADVVVVGALYQDLSGLTDPVELTSSGQSAPADTVLTSQCPDADAAAAESMAGSRGSVQLGEGTDATGCFPIAQGEDRTGYAYAIDATGGGGALRVLAIRALGHHEHVVWFDASQQQIPTVWDTVSTPPWMPVLLAQGVVIVCALAVVRGRRFGRIVAEDLPVVVHAAETTRGRGRLYRRAGARDRAAETLRSATALRLSRRLGLPRAAERDAVAHAAARATGWPPRLVGDLLCGPVPSNDRALAGLAVQLDRLESEVLPR